MKEKAKKTEETAEQKTLAEEARKKKSKKIAIIVWSVVGVLLAGFILLVLIAPYVLPKDNPLAKVLSSDSTTEFDIGKWFSDNTSKFLQTLFYIALFVGLSYLIPFIIRLFTKKRKTKGATVWNLIASVIKVLSLVIMIFVVLGVWGVDTATLLASAGILALVIGLSAQTLINDVLSGLAIIADDEFTQGDIVIIDDFRGTVEEVGVKSVKLLDAAGNIKVINNSSIQTVINLSRNPSVAIADLDVSYDTDLKQAEEIFKDHLMEVKPSVPEAISDPVCLGVQEFGDSGVIFRFIIKCREEDKFAATRKFNEAIWNLYDKYGLDVPYQTITIDNGGGSQKPAEKQSNPKI
jgi:small-conductance mechanosensitive channel